LVSVFHDNAGVVRAAPDLNLVFKVETHNSPSALDPYGGAITGIVGVNRDPFGTGVGAELLTNTWGYCFASPLFEGALPQGLHHPRRIRDGVHQGVIDGGNQSGIPYSRGFELFDERYLGKPLVFCGTVGWMPREIGGGPSERKEVEPGDFVVMVGGRIGKDGIHGATFSSEALHQESPAQAVQIGDAITQKMMTDMLLEARDQGLYRALTDNGAGGLSSSVGEMARLSGGAELDLEAAPLKYPGLMPWEILLSEAQERMSLAVPPGKLAALLALARRREVEATPIGRFTDDGYFRLRYAGDVVGELSLEFLHDGCPKMELEARWDPPVWPEPVEIGVDLADVDPGALLLDLMGSVNLCAKAGRCRQYDHEVKGLSVIKPLVGAQGDVAADASVMRIRHGSEHAVIVSEAIAPRLSDLDPGVMAGYVVDLAVRRIVAAGGRLGQIAALDNFCWPDPVQSESTPDGRQKLAGLVRCCESLHRYTVGLDLPLISGKDSMKNDSVRGGVKISIPPTLLLSVMGWIDDARRALDLVIDQPGRRLYLLGRTAGALAGGEAYAQLGQAAGRLVLGRHAPASDPESCRSVCGALERAIDEDLVVAAHAPHAGGLAVAFATLCLASELGLEVTLQDLPRSADLSPFELLFAEDPSRLLVGIASSRAERFEQTVGAQGVPLACIGQTTDTGRLTIRAAEGAEPIVDLSLAALGERFRGTLRE
jgi:phosphoribosylformylglycinamidine synthase II